MKVLIITASLFILAACSQSCQETGQADVQQHVHMPPETKPAYMEVEPALLASLKDPVCGMSVKHKVMDTLSYNTRLYGFCGTGCKDAFLKEPLRYQSVVEAERKN